MLYAFEQRTMDNGLKGFSLELLAFLLYSATGRGEEMMEYWRDGIME
jgi:hypothetical protein